MLGRLWRVLYAELQSAVRRREGRQGRSQRPGSHGDTSSRQRQPERAQPPRQDPVLAGYYANLEVPYGADLVTVRSAYKRLVKKYHPDLHSAQADKKKTATVLIQGLNKAYEELAKSLQ